MGNEGDILYFDPFYFKNGNASKPKYFIVLKSLGEKSLLASLPSSLNFCPADIANKDGCIEVPEACFNCFVFKGKSPVTTSGWCFPMDTYLYGQQIDEYEIAILKDIYPVEGLDYRIIGTLKSLLFQDMKKCFINSANVKRKFRKLLSS